MYWAILVVLLTVIILFACAMAYLAINEKPVPQEISIPLGSAIGATVAFLFGKHEDK